MKRCITQIASAVLAGVFAITTGAGVMSVSAKPNESVTVSYTFTGDEAEKAGFAQGDITVTPLSAAKTSGYYLVYYTDKDGVMEEYDELATVKITGEAVTHSVKDGTMIPVGATGIAVFENDVRISDEAPSIKEAVATASIPVEKQLLLGEPVLRFGAVSDVHMDYQGYARGAYEKWEHALAFFSEMKTDYVMVAGDMTGDTMLDREYQKYIQIIEDSDIPLETVYESIGNHGNTPDTIGLFAEYTFGAGEDHPYENSPYFSVMIEGKTDTERDHLFVFMAQELDAPGTSATCDNFSEEQIDWLESLLTQYAQTKTDIFIFEHAPFLNYGAGDRKGGGYTSTITFKPHYFQTTRLKNLLQKHSNAVVMSGHTHVSLYDGENYSDVDGTFARTVHIGSTCFPCGYGEGDTYTRGFDGRYTADAEYGSEGYIVDVYDDCIVYTGYNLSTGKIIPAACLLMPTVIGEDVIGEGTAADQPTVKPWMWGILGGLTALLAAGIGFVIHRRIKSKKHT